MSPPDLPAGPYVAEPHPTPARRGELIAEIEQLPARLRSLVGGLPAGQLERRYKNWNVRQIVHHLADSHMNAFVRFRLTLTEERPTIKPYDETRWAELPDSKSADVTLSLQLLEALHARWVLLLRAMSDADFQRSYFHPEYQKEFRLAEVLGLYAHHGRHHTGQIAWLSQ
ncbi:MAG TPA: putative metal-dependent hydrolase [Pirellulaceae bacterium]|nr:putative metal-dependent hydrolase [Pirellulaceae bacterium]